MSTKHTKSYHLGRFTGGRGYDRREKGQKLTVGMDETKEGEGKARGKQSGEGKGERTAARTPNHPYQLRPLHLILPAL
jgi:hypothetical protein